MCLIIFHFKLSLFYKRSSINTLQIVIDNVGPGANLQTKTVNTNYLILVCVPLYTSLITICHVFNYFSF